MGGTRSQGREYYEEQTFCEYNLKSNIEKSAFTFWWTFSQTYSNEIDKINCYCLISVGWAWSEYILLIKSWLFSMIQGAKLEKLCPTIVEVDFFFVFVFAKVGLKFKQALARSLYKTIIICICAKVSTMFQGNMKQSIQRDQGGFWRKIWPYWT